MPRIEFTSHLARHLKVSGVDVAPLSLQAAMDDAFQQEPKLRGYILDDQNAIRQHVAFFVDGVLLRDREQWDVPLKAESQVYVMQALSGG